MNVSRLYTSFLEMIRKIINCSSLRRQIFQYGSRNHNYHYQKGGRRWWDRRLLLAFTSATGFSFAEHGIPHERLNKTKLDEEFDDEATNGSCWEMVVNERDLKVYRRVVPDQAEMYEYKCVGTYYDISAMFFLDVQNDLAYRREWDRNVMALELLKEEDEHELIRWVQKYPYPFYPREYVYTRRTWICDDSRMLVVDSEIVPVHLVPGDSKNIRVSTYRSRMAVRSHKEFDSHGLANPGQIIMRGIGPGSVYIKKTGGLETIGSEVGRLLQFRREQRHYILTYFDNPQANIARPLHNWLVTQGGPYFLKQVHEVAREAERTGRCLNWTSERFKRIRQKSEERTSAVTSETSKFYLLKDKETNIVSKMDESELENSLSIPKKSKKFPFSSLDNIPVEMHITA